METSSVCLSLQISLTFLQVPVAIMKNLYHSSFISYLPCFGVLLFSALISATSSISSFLIFCLCFLCGIFRHHLLHSNFYFVLICFLSFIYLFILSSPIFQLALFFIFFRDNFFFFSETKTEIETGRTLSAIFTKERKKIKKKSKKKERKESENVGKFQTRFKNEKQRS